MSVEQVIALAEKGEWVKVCEVLTEKVKHIPLGWSAYDELIPFWIDRDGCAMSVDAISLRYEVTERDAQSILNILEPYSQLQMME